MTSCGEGQVLSETESVCPECLARIPARRVAYGHEVYLQKTCPEHGHFQTIIWRGPPDFASWVRPKIPSYPDTPFTSVDKGCPFDCGLCPDHRQQTCTALLEVTQRCDLRCPICFADAGGDHLPDPDLTTIESWYRQLLKAGGPYNIQLSGGEPTMRSDLPKIVALGRSLGFKFIQVNTNGLRLSRDPAYVRALKEAGLASVFLQFDGTTAEVYQKLRGAPLLAAKQQAIKHCAEVGLGIILTPTLTPGVNTHHIGDIIEFALRYAPHVRGVHFQPISYFGRYPHAPSDADRITIPETIQAIETQTGGAIRRENFSPPGCENALCSFHGNFVLMPEGQLKPLTKHIPQTSCCCQPIQAKDGAEKARQFVARNWSAPDDNVIELCSNNGPSLGEWDVFLARAQSHAFCISGMAFQDAWTLDLERLRDCCIHTVSPDGRIIPFCAYNLTNQHGRSLYRQGAGQERLELSPPNR